MSRLAALGGKPVGKMNIPKWPVFDQVDADAVAATVMSGQWAFHGPREKELEEKLSARFKARHGVAVANGTVALKLSLEALGICPGDEVIVPGLTWQATASAVLDVNAVPVLADIDPATYTIDPKAVQAAITTRTRCIIPVHLYGRVADMDAIMDIARKYKLFVVEDCAHQHGAKWKDRYVGTIGDIGSFSFQASKILNTGEGGFLTTDDEGLHDLLQSLKSCGRPHHPGASTMQSGNYRMTEFQAALALSQLVRFDSQNDLREKNARYMDEGIAGIEGIGCLERNPNITRQTYYAWVFKYLPEMWAGVPRGTFLEALHAELENSPGPNIVYESLDNCSLYQPYSKHTHKISEEYWQRVNPARFDVPQSRKAAEVEGVAFLHYFLLAGREDCDKLLEAIRKLRSNVPDLIEYSRM